MSKNLTFCPLCNSSSEFQEIESTYVYGDNSGKVIMRCIDCDFYYLTPCPTQEELNYFYENNFEEFMSDRSGIDSDWSNVNKHQDINHREYLRREEFITKYVFDECRILEIGASTGFMLSGLLDYNKSIQITAVEPSNQFSKHLQNMGISTYKYIEDISHYKYDLILHFFVMAHIGDIESFMQKCYDKLDTGGVMVFETPCASDPLYSLYDIPKFKDFYWQVAHVYSFTRKSMEYFLDKMGWSYKIIPHQRYGMSNHMTWMQTGLPGGRGRYSSIFPETLNESYKRSLEGSQHYDTIFVEVYKK